MSYLYGVTDTKFKKRKLRKLNHEMPKSKFKRNSTIPEALKYDRNACPIDFRVNPASLTELALNVVDKLPLPSVYEWSYLDVIRWISRYGYPQYKGTFRVNMVWGRKLLLLDAAALSAMNIKNFEHIKHITYGIRMLFHFELAKFSRSLTLPDEYPYELYLLWHTQTGLNYDAVRCGDLLRRMQLIAERSPNRKHWELLELWLRRERERKILIGLPYRPKYNPILTTTAEIEEIVSPHVCNCMPPCECYWEAHERCPPWRLKCLKPEMARSHNLWLATEKECTDCVPPCECRWPCRFYLTGTVLNVLREGFPNKFSSAFNKFAQTEINLPFHERWVRFSV